MRTGPRFALKDRQSEIIHEANICTTARTEKAKKNANEKCRATRIYMHTCLFLNMFN